MCQPVSPILIGFAALKARWSLLFDVCYCGSEGYQGATCSGRHNPVCISSSFVVNQFAAGMALPSQIIL